MHIFGPIHMIELDNKIIGIKQNKRIMFFYFQNSQMNLFKRYLYQDNWIDLEYNPELVKKGHFLAHPVNIINRIEAFGKYDHIVYYNKKKVNNNLYDFLNDLENVMFLDLEMTMPSYQFKGKGFITELIQAGLVIFDKNGNELYKYNNYVLPTVNEGLTKRAFDFLHIDKETYYNNAISYDKFYDDFNEVLDKYNPAIIVFGKNDIKVINESYEINKKESLENKTRFINILKLIKTYYSLKNDPGLFKLYEVYYNVDDEQTHDALDDSFTTYMVYKAFKEDIKKEKKYDIIRAAFL